MRIDEKLPLIYGVPQGYFIEGLKEKRVFVAELRPGLEGSAIVAGELLKKGIQPVVICDNMLAYCMQQGKVSDVHIFYRALDRNAGLCQTGSLAAALSAKAHRIPVYLHPARPLKIEAVSLLTIRGMKITSQKIKTYAPLFEEVPLALLRG